MTMKAIINADDFGLSPGVNRGIVSGFRDGILTSTTMLVNLKYFEDAVNLARENPDLPVGIHLSLLWGRPLSEPVQVPTLVRRDGCFPRSLSTLAARYFLGRLSREQVRLELRNQVRKFLDAGLTPTHLDTHKHVHCLPGILEALIEVAAEFGIERVRLPLEDKLDIGPPSEGRRPRPSWTSSAKRRLIRFLCRGSRARLRQAGIRTADHFVGIGYQTCLNSDVLHLILSHLRGGVTEIMCHPGYEDEPLREFSSTPPYREVELEGLKNRRVRDLVSAGAVKLTHYGDL